MAKRKIEIYVDVNTEKDFNYILNTYNENLICAQIYCSYFGYCTALDHLFLKIKLDWSDGKAILLRVVADDIDALKRFREQSVPIFLYILNKRVINIFRGVDYIRFGEVSKSEIEYFKRWLSGCYIERPTYDINEATPKEKEWYTIREMEREEAVARQTAWRASHQAARKKHRAELMIPHLQHLNFVLYWPHTIHAHPELYERWDPHRIAYYRTTENMKYRYIYEYELYRGTSAAEIARRINDVYGAGVAKEISTFRTNPVDGRRPKWKRFKGCYGSGCITKHFRDSCRFRDIIMVGREEIKLSKEMAEDVLYAGDAPVNEASMHVLLSAPALAICFRILDNDKNFVSLVRKILYEDLPEVDESKSLADQPAQKTAFDLYKTYSRPKEEILIKRRSEREKGRERAKESRARRLSEMQRMARQAIEDAVEAKRTEREARKIEILKSGNLTALEEFEKSSLDLEVDIAVPEQLSDEESEDLSEEEDENEFFPPAGLVVPGFYAPPNDIAKVNGLAILFPKIVLESVTPQPEFLPPHVLVLLDMLNRYKAIETLVGYKSAVIHMGIFEITSRTISSAVHVAYSVKQFDSLKLAINMDNLKLAVMLSIEIDLPLLELMDLSPYHVSRDPEAGIDECASMFSVDYGDKYSEFEDFDTVE